MANELNTTYPCESLGRAMPAGLPKTITVAEHAKGFYALDTCDVWTADGWLVTAVQNDGETHHLRRGAERTRRVLAADEILSYSPNAKATRWGY